MKKWGVKPHLKESGPVRKCDRKDIFRMYLVNVGNGNFVIVSLGEKCAVFDAGSNEFYGNSITDKNRVLLNIDKAMKLLKSLKLQFIFVSHIHADHLNLVGDILLNCYPTDRDEVKIVIGGKKEEIFQCKQKFIQTLRMGGIFDRQNTFYTVPDGIKESEFEDCVRKKGEELSKMLSECFDWMLDIKLYVPLKLGVFRPGETSDGFQHDFRNVFAKLDFQQRSILLPGDATEQTVINLFGSGEIARNDIFGRVDVLVAPHHGSNNNRIDGVVQASPPMAIVVSGDADLNKCRSFGLPRRAAIDGIRPMARGRAGTHTLAFWESFNPNRPLIERPQIISTEEAVFETGRQFFMWSNHKIEGLVVEIVPKAVIDEVTIDKDSVAYEMEFIP